MNRLNLNGWAILVAIMVSIGSVVAAHFNGINEAKSYTDIRVNKIDDKLDKIQEDLSEQKGNILLIKTMLAQRTGR